MDFKIGNFDILLLKTGTFWLDGGSMFGVVPKKIWQKFIECDEENRIPMALNCFLLKGDDFLLLVECGIGDWWEEKYNEIYKINFTNFKDLLSRFGIKKEEITDIFVSHLHFDHIGGSVEKAYDTLIPVFPNAKIYVQKEEIEHSLNPNLKEKASYKREIINCLAFSGKFQIIDGDFEIKKGVKAIKVGGHSFGMQILRIESEGKVGYFLGDLIPTVFHLKLNYLASYDLEPLKILNLKEEILKRAFEENSIFLLYHEVKIPVGFIKKDLEGNYFLEKLRESKIV